MAATPFSECEKAKERSVRTTTILLALAACLVTGVPKAEAGDADTVAAINAAVASLDAAFEAGDADAIKAMMTSDHVAVTPFYDGPQPVAAQLASLPELKYQQTIVGTPKVEALGPDAGMRTFEARFDGTFKGKPIAPRGFVTSILVKDGEHWHEKFYQVTAMAP
jgi:ketosteroid isomerase-like protein